MATSVDWKAGRNAITPFEAEIDGQLWAVRVNDFPDYPHLYTLLCDGDEIGDFNEWPSSWKR